MFPSFGGEYTLLQERERTTNPSQAEMNVSPPLALQIATGRSFVGTSRLGHFKTCASDDPESDRFMRPDTSSMGFGMLARGYASQGSIFSRYTGLGCANSVQHLLRLQQAILQPCASYACEGSSLSLHWPFQ